MDSFKFKAFLKLVNFDSHDQPFEPSIPVYFF